jgi:hypothetical protein
MPNIDQLLEDIVHSAEKDERFHVETAQLNPLINEINLIKNEPVQNFVRAMLLEINPIFWSVEAEDDSDGVDKHPIDEYDEGGMVKHTQRVVRAVDVLSEAYGLEEDERDLVIAAAILHDITKVVVDPQTGYHHYDPMHAYTVGQFMERVKMKNAMYGDESQSSVMYLSEDITSQIMRLIRVHQGLNSIIPETIPVITVEMVMHLAEVVATNLEKILVGG